MRADILVEKPSSTRRPRAYGVPPSLVESPASFHAMGSSGRNRKSMLQMSSILAVWGTVHIPRVACGASRRMFLVVAVHPFSVLLVGGSTRVVSSASTSM